MIKLHDVLIRESMPSDVDSLSLTMREPDRMEIYAQNHATPKEALEHAFDNSEICATVEYKGNVCAMFGVVHYSLMPHKAIIWLLTSDDIPKFKKTFVKLSRVVIKRLLAEYDVLFNYVDARYEVCLNWLKLCGADIRTAEIMGVEGLKFHYVEFRS